MTGGGPRDPERGSVLVLAVGWVIVALVAVVVLVDASSAFLQRRALVALADATALAAAQAIDLDAYYREGASAATTLDPRAVEGRARRMLARYRDEAPAGLRLDVAATDGRRVRIVLRAPLRLPFLGEWARLEVTAATDAQLAYRASG